MKWLELKGKISKNKNNQKKNHPKKRNQRIPWKNGGNKLNK